MSLPLLGVWTLFLESAIVSPNQKTMQQTILFLITLLFSVFLLRADPPSAPHFIKKNLVKSYHQVPDPRKMKRRGAQSTTSEAPKSLTQVPQLKNSDN